MFRLLGRFFAYCIGLAGEGEALPSRERQSVTPEEILREWLEGAEQSE